MSMFNQVNEGPKYGPEVLVDVRDRPAQSKQTGLTSPVTAFTDGYRCVSVKDVAAHRCDSLKANDDY